jgi:hypothetical protein
MEKFRLSIASFFVPLLLQHLKREFSPHPSLSPQAEVYTRSSSNTICKGFLGRISLMLSLSPKLCQSHKLAMIARLFVKSDNESSFDKTISSTDQVLA